MTALSLGDALVRVGKVLASCETHEQLDVAERYAMRVYDTMVYHKRSIKEALDIYFDIQGTIKQHRRRVE